MLINKSFWWSKYQELILYTKKFNNLTPNESNVKIQRSHAKKTLNLATIHPNLYNFFIIETCIHGDQQHCYVIEIITKGECTHNMIFTYECHNYMLMLTMIFFSHEISF